MKYLTAALAALCAAALSFADATLDGPVSVPQYGLAKFKAGVKGSTDKTRYKWDVQGQNGVRPVTVEKANDVLYFTGPPGVYVVKLTAVDFKAEIFDDAEATVTIQGPPVPPTPPTPPTPPSPPPAPPSPAPIPAEGFRVLIVEDVASRAKLEPARLAILFDKSVDDYLQAKCVLGDDKKTKEYRIWDKGVNASGESKLWQDALRRPAKSYPWILISTGKSGYEGPLPADVNETLALLKKYGGD